MDNGAWLALGAAAVAVGAASARGSVNRATPLKRGDRVAYNPGWVAKRPLGPGDKAYALAARGTVIAVSGPLVNVQWDGAESMQTYGFPSEVVRQQDAVARASARARTWDDMTISRSGELLTPEGAVPLKAIGKGMFSKIYRQDTPDAHGTLGRVIAVVGEDTWDKQIVSEAHKLLPDNPHLPAVERLGTLTDGRMVYAMPHYTAPYRKGNAKPGDHKAYLAIKECVAGWVVRHDDVPLEFARLKLDCIRAAGIAPAIVEAVEALVDTASNYGDEYNIEFSPRNVATDAQGNLILLDLLFNQEAAVRSNQQKRRKAGLSWRSNWQKRRKAGLSW